MSPRINKRLLHLSKSCHLDYLRPFKDKYFFTVIDTHSKWLDILNVNSTSANQRIDNLR